MDYECTVRQLNPQPVMSIRGKTTVANLPATIGEFLKEVWQHVEAEGGTIAGSPFTRYHGVSGNEIDLEAGIPVADVVSEGERAQAGELPGGEVVVTVHVGPYEDLPNAGEVLDAWLQENGREAAGPNWEVYVNDPGDAQSPAEYRTEVYKPLKPHAG